MFNIEKYLEKFSKNIRNAELNKTKILEIIKKHTNLNLLPEEIEIKNYIAYIKSSPAVKNKLFIHKNKILEEISTSLSTKIIDIK
ncbi:MAG: hypothetical protein UT65_C0020G0009 [Parcubacteria group bacterium GW2011_GWF2_39_8b]|uniref:Uncharacterized protein n=2 Tax=Candidatus Zambryskiibacteriota TaxID=1817925 RepID=A0A1G2UX91_9BACT|nr:MAG: hypothetical protein UT65_C0020G0009 [Parcubacteria group bacterium GW2011_GWF2_39_8b]KKR45351.1 MAG: hypothetical protein UT81_C0015G0009 [Parcubacteria group bacterium GW2011_GWA2_40_14]OHA97157.1 MAG: hypothetical protein A3C63_01715 [Candidatus Zambryskibacteria bacterium RIFCSPHIGHO2_02_FULL_39_82]OHA97435.1 MAG: hypothetical protein A3E32_02115 [Candidatus Zambryskibacteria bacterium RIFCSPHIGHO2_12_FULL_38_37]OHB08397.1 MAG: hypothetical protein A2W64_01765 [Candidatus Zambryskib